MYDIIVPMAPAGWLLFVARIQASAKQSLLWSYLPFKQATEKMKGHLLLLVKALTYEVE